MTRDPKAPNAAAVYLYLEKTVNDREHLHSTYAVIKVLTAGGKKWANVELPYDHSYASINSIQGRTIEPDGKVVRFRGKPYNKLIVKSGKLKVMAKVFTLPDVKVGCILEYRYILDYGNNTISSPQWYIQRRLFVHKAHYHFVPSKHYRDYTFTDAQGHKNLADHLLFSGVLPKGVKVKSELSGFDLVVKNVPALVKEKDEIPMDSVSERLLFYYSPFQNAQAYWQYEGKKWSQAVDHFAADSPVLEAAVKKIVSPGASQQQKALKIYEAVMKLDNTSFSRQHSAAENRAEGIRTRNATDIWEARQGTADEITGLFVAMARAAGLTAYEMRVADRDQTLFERDFLDWDQLDDDIAIVTINGKEVYLDPGERFEDFGKLPWFHCLTYGVRQTAQGTEITHTPGESYKWNEADRVANLTLASNGKISGSVRVIYSGDFSLRLRHEALEQGVAKLKQDVQTYWQDLMPAGVHVTVDHFLGLRAADQEMMEILKVSGTLGTRAGKMRIIPGDILEAGQKPLFTAPKRLIPIDLGPAHLVNDSVTMHLPPNYTVQGVPKNASLQYLPNTAYRSSYKVSGHTYTYARTAVVAISEYPTKDYPQLKKYFQQVSQADKQPLVFKVGKVVAKAGNAGKGAAGGK